MTMPYPRLSAIYRLSLMKIVLSDGSHLAASSDSEMLHEPSPNIRAIIDS